MADTCQHEAQLRHAKSRISQLEIMLDKERRKASAVPQQALIPRRPTNAEIMQAPEYRKLQDELTSEQKIKADLMSNLKEMVDANQSANAALSAELTELRAARDGHLCELDELQEEFDSSRTSAGLAKEQITATSLRTYLTNLVDAQHKIRAAVAKLPSDSGDDLSAALDRLIIDRNETTSLLTACEVSTISSAKNKFNTLQATQAELLETLQKGVPSTYEDLFTLLNRSASFSYPPPISSWDASAQDNYQIYLKTTTARLSHTIRKYITSHQKSRQKISYRSFNNGDLALFLPTRNASSAAWAAFNVGAPHYFLDMTGVETENKDFLIGRIESITEKNGEPGIETLEDTRKWWQVKISDKRKMVE